MACHTHSGPCRGAHIARPLGLIPNPRSPGDFEGPCPECGHGGYALSAPTRSKYRNIWSCNCRRCNNGKGCPPGVIRQAMLRKGINPWCLGSYDGAGPRAGIDPEAARRMDQAISDILAVPHLKPSDMRIVIAEAQGAKIPGDFTGFVKFARGLGIGKTQAQEAAARWGCRPSDLSSPHPGEGVVDTSRSTESGSVVKPRSSQPHERSETDQKQPLGRSETDRFQSHGRSVSDQRTSRDETESLTVRPQRNKRSRRPAA